MIDGLVVYGLRRIVPRKTPNSLFTASTAVLIEVADISVCKGLVPSSLSRRDPLAISAGRRRSVMRRIACGGPLR
ncbi:hypothetical protein IC762_07235 [Bradyrhizobium genosp. L]|uniref:hypothetical protein n=1 Tax=Bradyrhizobium genosp. L TaxID=83637 RepID=UPI0018A2CA9B|nr:hypothetical protein [Bradyrhizobium genosp. L]QPF86085.1 hypothetical protein IC762_07235 [Bradyrhizobium genosp. L]